MQEKKVQRIGILTGGGDCPGLNAVIRAIAKPAIDTYGVTIIGIEDGFEGLVEGRMRELTSAAVSGILNRGGTILGSSNKGDPWHYPVKGEDGAITITNASDRALHNYQQWELDALITIGGEGTMHISHQFGERGMNIVGVPKTIDNDLGGTDVTFGYDSAIDVATEAIDRLHTTASSHHRTVVIEVMGRYAGWIALGAGLAGGAGIILIPEIPFTWDAVFRTVLLRSTRGRGYTIVCVAEGCKRPEGGEVIKELDEKRTDARRFGGIGELVADEITRNTGLETRVTVLGHVQRGGSPSSSDRILATNFGAMALKLCMEGKFGQMVAVQNGQYLGIPMKDCIANLKTVPIDHPWIQTARNIGTSFGDQ